MDTAFQPDAFQTDPLAWQIDVGTPPVVPPGPPHGAALVVGRARRRRRRIVMSAAFSVPHPRWRAVLDYDDDDLALALLEFD